MNPLQIVSGIVGTAILIAIAGYLYHCESVKEAQAVAIVLAEQAKERAEKQAASDRAAKEKADEDLKASRADAASLARRLRNARAASSYLPPASPGSASPSRAAFDRAELERAIQRLDAGVSGLIEEGDQARVGLDSAKRWAQDIPR